MALDDVVLESRARGQTPNTLRFLRFDPPAVLVGYHQSVESEVRVDYCRDNGLDINRRITGGGAILFDPSSLGWEIIASKRDFDVEGDFFDQERLFGRICDGAIRGLRSLGIDARFRPKNDIEVNGRKISGTGGTEREGAFLFQGTVLVDVDVDTMLHALRIPLEKLKDKEVASVKERVTTVRDELGRVPPMDVIKRAIAAGFEESLGMKLTEGGLTKHEEELLAQRIGGFRSYNWVYLERPPLNSPSVVYAVAKTPGGLIRVSLTLDTSARTIKSVLITGDFFIFPSRAILDLEAALRGADCERGNVLRIVEDTFKRENVHIPGVTPRDIVDLIFKAAGKVRYESIGLTLAESNHIFEVNVDAEKPLGGAFSALLLPYCAKLPTCEYRERDGCSQCGGCTIGDAYRLAEAYNLKPITIVNFEDLMENLIKLRDEGATGYIGCCCEGFYCKHQDDFEGIGLPGILIDIDDTTCYDLGREHEALLGDFENQTSVKLGLLEKLVRNLPRGGRESRV